MYREGELGFRPTPFMCQPFRMCEDSGKKNAPKLWEGLYIYTIFLESTVTVSHKSKIVHSYDQAILLPGLYPEKSLDHGGKSHVVENFIAVLFALSESLEEKSE